MCAPASHVRSGKLLLAMYANRLLDDWTNQYSPASSLFYCDLYCDRLSKNILGILKNSL